MGLDHFRWYGHAWVWQYMAQLDSCQDSVWVRVTARKLNIANRFEFVRGQVWDIVGDGLAAFGGP